MIQKAVQKENQAIDGATASAATKATATAADAAGAPAEASQAPVATAITRADTVKPGQGAWANYDFKPGERILFADEFAADEVGDFPRRMEFKAGSLEIVEWHGTRFLRANSDSRWFIPMTESLPERYTMEFDYSIPTGGELWLSLGRRTSASSSAGTAPRWSTTTRTVCGRMAGWPRPSGATCIGPACWWTART